MTTAERAKQLAEKWNCRYCPDEIAALLDLLVEARPILCHVVLAHQCKTLIERIDKALGGRDV